MPSDPPNKLLNKAQRGDKSALTNLFVQHRPRLKRMIELRLDHRLRGRVDSSDVLQETYIDLAQQLPGYAADPVMPFYLWLRRIAGQRLSKLHRTHLHQQMRSAKRESRLDEEMPDASSVYMARQLVSSFTSASEKAIRNEHQLQLQSAIEKLSGTDREIVALRHVEQLSNDEIASILNIGKSAATNRYARAIRRLRESLAK